MANLILKPSTGGVLKIQNDAGTVDALSVNTSGNLTAAGTLAVTGNTTLSGTANNLGTVTAGTLGSAVELPSGTAINHVGGAIRSNFTSTSISSTTWLVNESNALTTKGANSGFNMFSGRMPKIISFPKCD